MSLSRSVATMNWFPFNNLDAVGGWSVATLAWVLIYFLDKTINTYEKLLNTTAREQVKPQSLG